jgi:hypothetical protein
MKTTPVNQTIEYTFTSSKDHSDPFNEIEVDAVFTSNDLTWRVPAFWAGGMTWKVRFAAPEPGVYSFKTACSDPSDWGLHGQEGQLEVTEAEGDNPLYIHGPIRTSQNRRYLEHADGTPFFWLGDTWWMGLCSRIGWPDEYKALTSDRTGKGFSVIQIVMGLYPDMYPFDERGANEAGFPWEDEYARIRPEYFDLVDERLLHLIASGLTPCLVGAWGYFINWMGVEKLKQHWRYLIARYASYPVILCVAGEANLPWYLADGFPYDDRDQVRDWTKVAAYVKQTDPFGRLLTIHPTGLGQLTARGAIDDQSLLDLDIQQTGHDDTGILELTVDTLRGSYGAEPVMPVLNSEVNYDGISDKCNDEIQRLFFWSCVLSGACGHTYGANGLWQLNRPGRPHGNSPHGGSYGDVTWEDAMNLPGSNQLGVAKKILKAYRWWEFAPHQEWIYKTPDDDPGTQAFAAGISGEVMFIYGREDFWSSCPSIGKLESGANHTPIFVDPVSGKEHPAAPDSSYSPPGGGDWLLIIRS